MNDFFKQLKNDADSIRLTTDEKSAMREKLLSAMSTAPHTAVPSPYFSFVMPRALVPALALVLVVLGSGVSFAAEGALPGDALYGIKVSVNERLRGAFAFSEEAKVEYHSTLAERRLEEAATLAASGELSEVAKIELEANFESHAGEVRTLLSSFESKDPVGAADMSARFESRMAARGAVIASIGSASADTSTKRESGRLAVQIAKKTTASMNADISLMAMQMNAGGAPDTMDQGGESVSRSFAKATLAPAGIEQDTDGAVAARVGEKVLDALAAFDVRLATLSERLGATTTARIKGQVGDLREFVERARAEGDSATARRNMEQALRDTEKLHAFLEAEVKFNTPILPTLLETDPEGAIIVAPQEEVLLDLQIR